MSWPLHDTYGKVAHLTNIQTYRSIQVSINFSQTFWAENRTTEPWVKKTRGIRDYFKIKWPVARESWVKKTWATRYDFKIQRLVDRRFHPVLVGFYCSKQWQSPGTERNCWSTSAWVLKSPIKLSQRGLPCQVHRTNTKYFCDIALLPLKTTVLCDHGDVSPILLFDRPLELNSQSLPLTPFCRFFSYTAVINLA